MAGRNAVEVKIHQAVLAAPDQIMAPKELVVVVPNAVAQMEAVNFLLSTGLLKVLKNQRGDMVYRAVSKRETDVKRDMSDEEGMVLSHIQGSGNEGIWTKHLKTNTQLHQTVLDRILKSLVQKKLIKCLKGNIKHPTRKIYMLERLVPSEEMTGGPWYTNNELDTEFIKLISSAILYYIKEQMRTSRDNAKPLFPIRSAPSYPSVQQIQRFIANTHITETELRDEHIERLLNVLVLDGEIEKLPACDASLFRLFPDEDCSDDNESIIAKRKQNQESNEGPRKSTKRRKVEEDSNYESHAQGGYRSDGDDSDDLHSRDHTRQKLELSFPVDAQGGSFGGSYVYRAIRPEMFSLGWSQAPCGHCPVFNFCKGKGPVNPQECLYYGDWLSNRL